MAAHTHESFASSNTRWLYVLIREGKRWKWLEMYHEAVIVDNIKLHKEAFVLEFLQQFSQYCLCFNLISIYFTPLYGFYWGCACFIAPISTRSEGQERQSASVYWLPLSPYELIWLSALDIKLFHGILCHPDIVYHHIEIFCVYLLLN